MQRHPRAVRYLSYPPACLREDHFPAHWAAAHPALEDPGAMVCLLSSLRRTGADEQAAALARRVAAHAVLDDLCAVADLLDRLREACAREQAAELADRAASYASPCTGSRRSSLCGLTEKAA